MNEEVVPVTIITGFLGAGKSTLIRRVLSEAHGHRIVVVENEFGDDTSIESAIVRRGRPTINDNERQENDSKSALSEIIELPNGCMCCSAQDELVKALSELVRTRRDSFDYICVETSGLADPSVVASMFWVDEGIESALKLDGVVTVVDGRNFEEARCGKTSRLIEKQVALSDLILLNKGDLIISKDMPEKLRRINGNAKVIRCEYCDVAVEEILNIKAYASAGLATTVASHEDHIEADLGTMTITFDKKSFVYTKLDNAFGRLLWEKNDAHPDQEIWRVKALVWVGYQRVIYQAVGDLFDSEEVGHAKDEREPRINRFVFIGRNLNRQLLTSVLEEAILD